MQKAGLDVNISELLDAFWLALQPGLRLESSAPVVVADSKTAPRRTPAARIGNPVAPGVKTLSPDAPGSTNTPDQPPPDDKTKDKTELRPSTGLFGAIAGEGERETLPASPLRVPAGTALASKLPLTRALRPLRRWFSNPQFQQLDEEATVDATAEAGGRMIPVLRPQRERWYELIVVADSVSSMEVWFETILELEDVARVSGVFRDIRHYRLVWKLDGVAAADGERVADSAVLLNAEGVPLRAVTLAQTNVRRLIFVATNGSSAHWTDGRMAELLTIWSKLCSVAIVQMLPERFWGRVRTGEPELLMRTLSPGAAAATLEVSALWWDADPEDINGNALKRIPGAVPVLPLDPAWIGRWARMQMGGGQRVPGIVVGKRADRDPIQEPATPQEWKKAVDAFTRSCTPEARILAVYLSQAPFTLPVARLVQATKMGKAASQSQLAEIMLSRLVQRITPADSKVPREWVQYQFHPEASKILVRGLRQSDAREIADALTRHIEHYWGRPLDFTAFQYNPAGTKAISRWEQPFAQAIHSLLGFSGAKSPRELVDRFIKAQPPAVVGRAAHVAAAAGHEPLRAKDPELWQAVRNAGLVDGDAFGEYRFPPEIRSLLAGIASNTPLLGVEILWVDDNPGNNTNEAGELASLGATVAISLETDHAVGAVKETRFDVIISDMARGKDSRAGFNLLERIAESGVTTPVIIYAERFARTGREAASRAGAFGCTNDPDELQRLVHHAAFLQSPRTIRGAVANFLRTLDFSPEKIVPEAIAAELLARAADPGIARRNHLQLIRAFAGSAVNQLIVPENGRLRVVADVSDGGKSQFEWADSGGLIGRAAKTGQIVWVPDVSRDKGYIASEPTTASELVLPLCAPVEAQDYEKPGPLALINIEIPVKNALFPDEIDWLVRFASPLAEWIVKPATADAVSPPTQLRRLGRKVLVVGTALYELPFPVVYAARAVGEALASAGFDLVSGGCQGADYMVAEAYVHFVKSWRANVDERFTQIVERGRAPDFPGGRMEYVSGDLEWKQRVAETADAIVIVGGRDGSLAAARDFLKRGKPVIPLPGTGDAARELWLELRVTQPELGELSEALDIPIAAQNEAHFASAMAVAILESVVDPAPNNRAAARAALIGLRRFMEDGDAGPDLLEAAWRWNSAVARQALKAWVQMPPDPASAESVLQTLPSLFGSPAAVFDWFQNQVDASPAEWQASLKMLKLLPIARRYLEPKSADLYERDADELRDRIREAASVDGIASCLRSQDAATRILGYLALQSWSGPSRNLDLAPCFALERGDARRWRETRPLWQLLVCVDRLGPTRGGTDVNRQLNETRTFLYANNDIDPGRECRNELERILFRRRDPTGRTPRNESSPGVR